MSDSGVGLDTCYCIHAEENAVIEGGRSKISGGTAYITTFPCLTCSKKLVQAGVLRIVYDIDYPMPIVFDFFSKLTDCRLEKFKS
jgi:dCMP deaminase